MTDHPKFENSCFGVPSAFNNFNLKKKRFQNNFLSLQSVLMTGSAVSHRQTPVQGESFLIYL